MKIAFYDDEAVHRDILNDYLAEFSLRYNIELTTYKFHSASELLNSPCDYQVLLLDIKLENKINGIDIAKELRQKGFRGIILLITSAEEFVFRGYEAEAFRYLIKPLKKDEFFNALHAAYEKLQTQMNMIEISFNGEKNYINTDHIIYIESLSQVRLVHTKYSTYETKENIASLSNRLPQNQFAAPHKSFLINLEHIKKSTASQIVLSNNTTLKISRGYHDEFIRAFHRYIITRGVL